MNPSPFSSLAPICQRLLIHVTIICNPVPREPARQCHSHFKWLWSTNELSSIVEALMVLKFQLLECQHWHFWSLILNRFFMDQNIGSIYTQEQGNFFEVVPWVSWTTKMILITGKGQKAVFPDCPNARVLGPQLALSNLQVKHPARADIFDGRNRDLVVYKSICTEKVSSQSFKYAFLECFIPLFKISPSLFKNTNVSGFFCISTNPQYDTYHTHILQNYSILHVRLHIL